MENYTYTKIDRKFSIINNLYEDRELNDYVGVDNVMNKCKHDYYCAAVYDPESNYYALFTLIIKEYSRKEKPWVLAEFKHYMDKHGKIFDIVKEKYEPFIESNYQKRIERLKIQQGCDPKENAAPPLPPIIIDEVIGVMCINLDYEKLKPKAYRKEMEQYSDYFEWEISMKVPFSFVNRADKKANKRKRQIIKENESV